jgi:hypothetical protein
VPWTQEAPAMQAQDESGTTPLQGLPARVEPDADDAPLCTISVGVDGADPWPGDDARSLRCDLVLHGASPSTPRHTVLSDVVPAPGFLGATSPGVARLLLSSSLSSPSVMPQNFNFWNVTKIH